MKTDKTKQTLPKPLTLRPSSATNWSGCPASAVLFQWLEDERTESPWLIEGTNGHRLAEVCLKSGDNPSGYIGKEIPVTIDEGTEFERVEMYVVDSESAGYINYYLNIVEDCLRYVRKTDGDAELIIEGRVTVPFKGLDISGTADVIIVSSKRIFVIDLKFGRRVEVFAVDNKQLSLYTLGAVNEYFTPAKPLEEIVAIIVQPRLENGESCIKRWNIENPNKWIKETTKYFARVVAEILKQETILNYKVSPVNCHWCDAMRFCGGLWGEVETMIHNIGTEVPELPKDVIRKILTNADPINDFLWAIKKHSTTRALSGETFDGFKLVEGGKAGNRYWPDPTRLTRMLDKKIERGDVEESAVFKSREPVSPAQLEKAIDKKFVSKYCAKPASNRPTILVPDTDKRRPIATAADEFSEYLDTDAEDFGDDFSDDFDDIEI